MDKAPKVRVATKEDAVEIAALAARTFRDAFAQHLDAAVLDAYLADSFSTRRVATDMEVPGSTFLVVEIEGTIVGYAHLVLSPMPTAPDTHAVRIVRMYVQSAMIGTGIGSRLMDGALSHALSSGCRVVWLRVWEHNTAAIRFYERWSFALESKIEFEMLGGLKTDWVMVRRSEA